MSVEWKKVTWYSQLVALILFIAVFCVGFILGQKYASPIQTPTILPAPVASTPIAEVSSSTIATSTDSVVATANFSCDGGKSIQAIFMTNNAEISLSDGRTLNLEHAISADGGRYTNTDESLVFWTKGNGAFFQENGKTTYANCTVTK